jgi:hypothetical protein
MSAVRSLLREKRTSRGQPISVEIDPQRSSAATKYFRESAIDMDQMRAAVIDIQMLVLADFENNTSRHRGEGHVRG